MSGAADQANFPTMIIPKGTEIRVNVHGQLSIKTPGNLVIQNSGTYSEIESTNGSIRIEENVTVEAVSVRAGQACFIQGTLTAWKVHAKRITLEDRAKAFIMLQESEHLELSKSARLVGNFSNEKELFFMMGKFSPQLKELPGTVDMSSHPSVPESRPSGWLASSSSAAPSPTISAPAATTQQMPANREDPADHLRNAQSLLERATGRSDLGAADSDAMQEVLYALRERNVTRVGSIYREALAGARAQSETVRQAADHLDRYFQQR